MTNLKSNLSLVILAFTVLFNFNTIAKASTLSTILERDRLLCGIDEQHFGFSYIDIDGLWRGFEVDLCRALAASILGDAEKTVFIPLNTQTRFTALRDQEIDILLRSTTWTYSRDMLFDFDFPVVTYYDRLAILARKNAGITKFSDVKDGTLCVANASTTLKTMRNLIKRENRDVIIKVFNSRDGLNNLFFTGQCDFYAADHAALISILHTKAPRIEDYLFLEFQNTKEPLGPAIRANDRDLYGVIKWVIFGLIKAEENGITSKNIEQMMNKNDPGTAFLQSKKPNVANASKFNDKWLFDAIRQIGNYGEIFDKNLGSQSPFKMERGLNELWTKGGLMYAIPFR